MEQLPTDYRTRLEESGRVKLRVSSYRLGDEFVCTVDNIDPGAVIARARKPTREEAEAAALQRARHVTANPS